LKGIFIMFSKKSNKNPEVKMEITINDPEKQIKGELIIELFAKEAPISVKNFLSYVENGFYNKTIFHRVIDGFMIQGGGFEPGLQQKETNEPIKNEANNGQSNKTGTLAMARTSVVDSATAQFFINVNDNDFLDYKNDTPEGYGYAVFGKVTKGMDFVDKIKDLPTTTIGYYSDVPKNEVIIEKITLL